MVVGTRRHTLPAPVRSTEGKAGNSTRKGRAPRNAVTVRTGISYDRSSLSETKDCARHVYATALSEALRQSITSSPKLTAGVICLPICKRFAGLAIRLKRREKGSSANKGASCFVAGADLVRTISQDAPIHRKKQPKRLTLECSLLALPGCIAPYAAAMVTLLKPVRVDTLHFCRGVLWRVRSV